MLYLGIGAGRLAAPLSAAGVQLIGVDSHPLMLQHLARRLPLAELIRSRIEGLDLKRRFDLVMVPSNILYTVGRLRGAAAQLAPGGRLAFELANPHWLEAGGGEGVRVLRMDGNEALLEIDYRVGERAWTQVADVGLVWPEEVDRWLPSAGLRLERMFGEPDAELSSSATYYVISRRRVD
ncbi:MAG: hypothetical protein PVSMB9_00530 [Candidatus Dormibacteria bacterium]